MGLSRQRLLNFDSILNAPKINGMNPGASPKPVFDASVGESTHALVRP